MARSISPSVVSIVAASGEKSLAHKTAWAGLVNLFSFLFHLYIFSNQSPVYHISPVTRSPPASASIRRVIPVLVNTISSLPSRILGDSLSLHTHSYTSSYSVPAIQPTRAS